MRRITPDEISEEDMLWLLRGLVHHGGHTPANVVEELCHGRMQLWRVPPHGVLVTQILVHPAGKELYIWALAGQGLLANAREVYAGLEGFAKEMGCRWIGGQAVRKGLGRVYERVLGASPVATVWLKEV